MKPSPDMSIALFHTPTRLAIVIDKRTMPDWRRVHPHRIQQTTSKFGTKRQAVKQQKKKMAAT